MFCLNIWPTARSVSPPNSCKIAGLLHQLLGRPNPVSLPIVFLAQSVACNNIKDIGEDLGRESDHGYTVTGFLLGGKAS